MSFLRRLHSLFAFTRSGRGAPRSPAGLAHGGRDSRAAASELSRLLADRHGQSLPAEGASDISLALGNLFRAQGDIERAVALREAVLAHPKDASPELRARTFFELGRDYRKAGFIDRAHDAFREAAGLGFPSAETGLQLAKMYADSGDFAAAAAEYARLDMPFAEAACLVRLASESASRGNDGAALRLIRQALTVYPGAPEAWSAMACMSLAAADAQAAVEQLAEGLSKGSESGRLILLEEVYAFATGRAGPEIPASALESMARGLAALPGASESVITCYYSGLFLQLTGKLEEAEQCHAKALVLDPDFWGSRLALLDLCARREKLPPLLKGQVDFFTALGAVSKRFICSPCGMRREIIFSECPRCRAWHSALFRLRLN